MNAMANPRILYLLRKSLNSFQRPFGGGGSGAAGFGSTASRIFFNSANISSSLTINFPSVFDCSTILKLGYKKALLIGSQTERKGLVKVYSVGFPSYSSGCAVASALVCRTVLSMCSGGE